MQGGCCNLQQGTRMALWDAVIIPINAIYLLVDLAIYLARDMIGDMIGSWTMRSWQSPFQELRLDGGGVTVRRRRA